MYMKKGLLVISLITIICLMFTACDKDEWSATAKVQVTQNGLAKSGETVYMFKSSNGPNANFYKPFFADNQSVTKSDGVATFELQEVYYLELIDEQTTLYFGVFDGEAVLGQTALTIKKGETKTVNIAL